MRKNNNTIKINGRLYNARTGSLLEPSSAAPLKTTTSRPAKHAMSDIIRRPAKPTASHAPKPARTLMRQAVKKPAPSLKRHHKAQGHTDTLAARPLAEVIVKPSSLRIDEDRLRHAKQIPHSNLISHFPASLNEPASRPIAAPKAHHADSKAHAVPPHKAPVIQAKKTQTTADLLERAIAQADSHLQPPKPLPRKSRHDRLKRTAGVVSAVGLSVIALAVIVIQNAPTVHLQMASSKAGFNVSLPSYKPAGYGLGELSYSSGVAAAQFRSHSDDRSYTITQKISPWDSQALLDNFVAPSYSQHQTVSAGGRTIYIYGNQDATWVNGGVWYVIQSDGSLNNRQLVDLAASL